MEKQFTVEELDKLPVHFILCTERTGSTLLVTMLNQNEEVISTSEEPFAIFFYKKYRFKSAWTEEDINTYINEFWLMAEKSLELYFTSREQFYSVLLSYRTDLNYHRLMKLTYLQFIEPKPKDKVRVIIDKQIKYFFYLPLLFEIFPDAKYVVLVRDVRDNVISKSKRGLNSSSNAMFLSALWYYTYQNIKYLQTNNKSFRIIRYEDMVLRTSEIIKEICDFYGINYTEEMIRTEGKYEVFLNARRPFVSSEFLEHLTDFHSGLFTKPNASKIGIYKNQLDVNTEGRIIKLNKEIYDMVGYENVLSEDVKFSFSDKCQMLFAYCYRPLLLRFYYAMPFNVKLLIKKIRKPRVKA